MINDMLYDKKSAFAVIGRIHEVMEMSNRFLIDIEIDNDSRVNLISITFPKGKCKSLKKENLKVGNLIGARGYLDIRQLQVGVQLIADKLIFMEEGK